MNIILISGLWPSKDSNGLEGLASEFPYFGKGIHYEIRTYDDESPFTADIIIAHSFGANTAMKYCQGIANIKYIAYIEPVRFWWSQAGIIIPETVQKADCFNRKGLRLPPSVTIKNPILEKYDNHSIPGLDHANSPRNGYIQSFILSAIKELS